MERRHAPRRHTPDAAGSREGEARLGQVTHGFAPVTDGWFVLNAADAGDCRVLVEGEERALRPGDLFHRSGTRGLLYPRADVAVRHRAAAEQETSSGAEAYASRGHWQPRERPAGIP